MRVVILAVSTRTSCLPSIASGLVAASNRCPRSAQYSSHSVEQHVASPAFAHLAAQFTQIAYVLAEPLGEMSPRAASPCSCRLRQAAHRDYTRTCMSGVSTGPLLLSSR